MNSDYSVTNKRYDKKIYSTHKSDDSLTSKRPKSEHKNDDEKKHLNPNKTTKKDVKPKKGEDKGQSVDFLA